MTLVGALTAFVLALLGALHVYWAAGSGHSLRGVVPERNGAPTFRPGKVATLAVAAALFSATAVVLGRLGWWGAAIPGFVFRAGTWTLALVFLLRAVGNFTNVGFFKREGGTRFARLDSLLYSPLSLALSLGSATAACA